MLLFDHVMILFTLLRTWDSIVIAVIINSCCIYAVRSAISTTDELIVCSWAWTARTEI